MKLKIIVNYVVRKMVLIEWFAIVFVGTVLFSKHSYCMTTNVVAINNLKFNIINCILRVRN